MQGLLNRKGCNNLGTKLQGLVLVSSHNTELVESRVMLLNGHLEKEATKSSGCMSVGIAMQTSKLGGVCFRSSVRWKLDYLSAELLSFTDPWSLLVWASLNVPYLNEQSASLLFES